MRKISVILIAAALLAPAIGVAADKEAVDDQVLVTASSYQEGEDVSDPTSPVAEPVAAESQESPAAAAASVVAAPAVQEANPTAKIVDTLSERIVTLENDSTQLQQQNGLFSQQIAELEYMVYGLTGLVILLMLLLLVRRSRKPRQTKGMEFSVAAADSGKTVKLTDDTQSEYDFMGSSEAIPAKLDLARAYIAMEDFNAARETLNEILSSGTEQQRQEARELLNKISK